MHSNERPNSMDLQEPTAQNSSSNIHVVEQYQYLSGQPSVADPSASAKEVESNASAQFRRNEPQMGFDQLRFD